MTARNWAFAAWMLVAGVALMCAAVAIGFNLKPLFIGCMVIAGVAAVAMIATSG